MAYKQKGFPMHITKSALKHTIKLNEAGEETSPHPHKNDDGVTHYSNFGSGEGPSEGFLEGKGRVHQENRNFNDWATGQGLIPNFDELEGEEKLNAQKAFYSNRKNINMVNAAQKKWKEEMGWDGLYRPE